MTDKSQKHIERVCERFDHPQYFSAKLDEAGLDSIKHYRKAINFTDCIDYTPYMDRKKQRNRLVVDRFKPYFGDSVLNIGSRDKSLEEMLGRPVSIVDKNNPDLPEFNWEIEQLPYEDGAFETVVCLDTLEHIDALHKAFKDMMRVSSRYVVMSLPNNWKKALNEFIRGRGRWASYGIPPERPFDRHKWFFNTEDVEDFVYYHAAASKENYEIKEAVYHIPKTIPRIKITHPILKAVLPEHSFKNLFTETVFFVFEKK